MAQYRYFHEGQLKVDPTTGTKCRTGQLNHQFVEQKFVGGVWIGIGDNDGVRYGDVAGAGCRFREGMRDGDYVVDVETEIAGFLLVEGDGWVNCGGVSGLWTPQYKEVLKAITGTQPSGAVKIAQNNFIKYLLGDNYDSRNVWDKLACLMPLMSGMPTASDSLFDWIDPTRKATLSATAPTYLQGQGFYGNGTSSYINTTFNPSTDGGTLYTRDNCSSGFLFTSHRTTHSTGSSGLVDAGGSGIGVMPWYAAAGILKTYSQGAVISYNDTARTDNLISLTRGNSTQITNYHEKTSNGVVASNSTALVNGTVKLLALDVNGTIGSFMTDTIGLFYAGSNLDATDIKVLNDAIENLVDTLSIAINSGVTITVGAGKDYATLNGALNKAISGSIINVDAGTFNESISLRYKKLTINGSGVLGTIINYDQSALSITRDTVNIRTDSAFNNVLFKTLEGLNATEPILNISNCNPVFTDSKVGGYAAGYVNQYPMRISNKSLVSMTGCSIDCLGNHINLLLITDTSVLNFEGTVFKALLTMRDTSIAIINTDEFGTTTTSTTGGLVMEDDSTVSLTINTREVYFNGDTGLERTAGTYSAAAYNLYDNANLTLSGNQITGATRIRGAGVVVLYKDIISTLGHFWCNQEVTATGSIVTFNNCQIILDCDSDNVGLHIIECIPVTAQVNIINGSILEFSGHNGNWFTMGNPIALIGKLVIRNSQVIDNCNDNIPYGSNYGTTISAREVDFEDAIITNQNWDTVGDNVNLLVNKDVGRQMKIRLKNVIFNNTEITSAGNIGIVNSNALDVDDYICEDNVTYNNTGVIFGTSNGDPVIILAALRAACPA